MTTLSSMPSVARSGSRNLAAEKVRKEAAEKAKNDKNPEQVKKSGASDKSVSERKEDAKQMSNSLGRSATKKSDELDAKEDLTEAEAPAQAPPSHLRDFAEGKFLTTLVFTAVFMNGIQMGVATDHPELQHIYDVLDNCFTAIFAFEFFVKIIAFRLSYYKSGWNCFDFILTWVSIIDLWILSALGASSGMKSLTVLRIFRIFRAVRLLRMLHSLRELAMIVEGLVRATATTGWVSILLVLMLYIFAIFMVKYCGQEGVYPEHSEDVDNYPEVVEFNPYLYFGTMPRAMYTLLNVALLTDDWGVISRPLFEKQPLILCLLLMFVSFATFGLLNVIMSIIVESVLEQSREMHQQEDDEEKRYVLQRLEQLADFVHDVDKNGDDVIEGWEIAAAWERPEMQEVISVVNLPIGANADELVDLIDSDGDGKLDMEEFVTSFVRLLTNDMYQQILEIKRQQNRLKRDFVKFKGEVDRLPVTIREEVGKEAQEMKAQIVSAIRGEIGYQVRTRMKSPDEVPQKVADEPTLRFCGVNDMAPTPETPASSTREPTPSKLQSSPPSASSDFVAKPRLDQGFCTPKAASLSNPVSSQMPEAEQSAAKMQKILAQSTQTVEARELQASTEVQSLARALAGQRDKLPSPGPSSRGPSPRRSPIGNNDNVIGLGAHQLYKHSEEMPIAAEAPTQSPLTGRVTPSPSPRSNSDMVAKIDVLQLDREAEEMRVVARRLLERIQISQSADSQTPSADELLEEEVAKALGTLNRQFDSAALRNCITKMQMTQQGRPLDLTAILTLFQHFSPVQSSDLR